ncbi:TetR/AcrR family transcriptional regulator [Blastococcus saxobsidens]|uniref:TetR family transcriptional regulator n=1 Tax=Blastococcus saxobsidens TaxID=138336 RepID=A0A4Q7YBF3_9ACTN|nr:TetR/AcrR family transcriptional regulator [Blastococcus saxobsidens]RZU33914.1 TetR family transcriptional regulator [Blastococcus saxobsidens]
MPRLREGTLAAHRSVVQAAILDATGALVARGGLRAVTMSQVAADAGIGRATLYRYFPDVDALLHAWHERRLGQHLHELAGLRRAGGPALDRLAAVLQAFGSIRHRHPGVGDAAPLHGGAAVTRAHGHVREMVHGLVSAAAADGAVRTDVPPAELAAYCLASLDAAAELGSGEAVERLVAVTLDGLRPRG